MDLLDCETGSRCATCRHSMPEGCSLALALEDALEARAPRAPPTLVPLLAWAEPRAAAES